MSLNICTYAVKSIEPRERERKGNGAHFNFFLNSSVTLKYSIRLRHGLIYNKKLYILQRS